MASNREVVFLCIGLLIAACLMSWASFADGGRHQLRISHQEAVDAGVAEWVATTDGNLEFKYIQCGDADED